jgi:hypothetical protein
MFLGLSGLGRPPHGGQQKTNAEKPYQPLGQDSHLILDSCV